MNAKKLIATACVLLASTVTFSGPLDLYYYNKIQQQKSRTLKSDLANTKVEYYPQLIDHQHPDRGTFMQRYYADETYGKSNDAPVFFYICGEAACYPSSLDREIRVMAKQYHAKLVALEHRYYGKSLPTKSFSAHDLQYLSTDYALKDLARFQKHMTDTRKWTGKWVAFGGSYPGSLSAYYRLVYPNNVTGSLASSAPVMAKENFEEFDEHVTKIAGPACVANMRAAYKEVEDAMSDPVKMAAIKHSFGVDKLKNNLDLLFLLADTSSAAVQYGFKDYFCNLIDKSSSPLTGSATFAKQFYDRYGIKDPMLLTSEGVESENPSDYDEGVGIRQWYYQSCKEYGYWQPAHQDPEKSMRSPKIDLSYFHHMCDQLFGIKTPAATKAMNKRFYTPLMKESTTHIFFTNGSDDPWSRLSMTEENGNTMNKNLNYYTIADGSHCTDLHEPDSSDSASLQAARKIFADLIGKWLV